METESSKITTKTKKHQQWVSEIEKSIQEHSVLQRRNQIPSDQFSKQDEASPEYGSSLRAKNILM